VGFLQIPHIGMNDSQKVESGSFLAGQVMGARQLQCFLCQVLRLQVAFDFPRQVCLPHQAESLFVVNFTALQQAGCRLEGLAGFLVMAQADQEDAAAVMQTGLQYRCIRQVQCQIRKFHALGIPAAQVVEEINRLQAVVKYFLMVGLDCVNPRLPDIILVRGEFSQDAGLVWRVQLFLAGSQTAQGCFTVAVADVLLPCRVQGKFFSRVLPQAFVQVVAPAASLAYQEVIRQGLNLGGVCVGDLHRRCFGKTAVEDPQAGKEFLFGRFQQAPGMINRGAQAAVPGWHVDQFGGEGIHGAAQVGSQAGKGPSPAGGGSQFQAERGALHQLADSDGCCCFIIVKRRAAPHPPGGVHQ